MTDVEQEKQLKVILLNPVTFNTGSTFIKLFDEVFSPAMDKFRIDKSVKPYVIHFYLGGLIAVVKEWIQSGCETPVDEITRICMGCIMPGETFLK